MKKILIENKVVTIENFKTYPKEEIITDVIQALVMVSQSNHFSKETIIERLSAEWEKQ